MVCRSAIRAVLQRSFAHSAADFHDRWRGSRPALPQAIRKTRLRRRNGRQAGTSRSRTSSSDAEAGRDPGAAATWNTPTKSCPRISPRTNGCRWRRSILPARSTCITPWSTSGRRIPTWLRHAPIGVPFTASTLSDPQDRLEAHGTTSDLLLVYAPGSSPDHWPDGMAKFVPAGSDLVFQMHYTTNGTAGR